MGRSHDIARGASTMYQTQAASDTRYVNATGDNVTGNFGINSTATAALDVRRSDTNGKIAEFHQSSGYGLEIHSSQSRALMASGYLQDLVIDTDAGSGGVERMRVTKEGRVTMPSQPSFRAASTGGINTGSNVSTLVLPSVHHNVGNHYNSSNYTFTCPVAGVYYFGFHGNVRDVGGNATGSLYGQIMKNGGRVGIYYCSDEPNAAWHFISGQTIVSCAVNDVILVSSGANAYWDSSDWTQFYGYLLG